MSAERLPTRILCEVCGLEGRAYQFPIDKNYPARRNRGPLCFACWHASLGIEIGESVVVREGRGWSTQEMAGYANRQGRIVGYSPSGGARGWEVEIIGGSRDGARLWLTLNDFDRVGNR